ncbi:hypothetical protein RRG08_054796 [Elysia crispata]|uniref:Uncharacterized protein n=1 Tax=Elysia crispata TaxID=231223 RepID=A0AAE1CXR7_9GAST|nr:hypothetical protein RRG08_054796 [Elysia crispata]
MERQAGRHGKTKGEGSYEEKKTENNSDRISPAESHQRKRRDLFLINTACLAGLTHILAPGPSNVTAASLVLVARWTRAGRDRDCTRLMTVFVNTSRFDKHLFSYFSLCENNWTSRSRDLHVFNFIINRKR